MTKILIGGVETFSTVDFPEHLSAVVFMQGCPWACPFCHNHELQTIGKETDFIWEKFADFLKTRCGILDSVVFSGGEPLVQVEALKEKIAEVKAMGFQIGLHTGGYRPQAFAKVLPLVDWVGFDIKAPFEEHRYKSAVGGHAHLENVKQSLEMLIASGKSFECRTTCDPRILNIDDIYTIADFLHQKGVKEYYLQRYRQVEGDKTPDSLCDSFFADEKLLAHLKNLFTTFDIRK